ncbi:MAG TPA: hypothetical protein VGO71_21635 [Baekduia sp.]|jgi:uncharacterized membrane protein HdeD (DUF308 family)|nr:hypothetical protein [Baekduia sp.]
MAKPRDVHRQTTLLFSSVMVLLGVAMIVRTVVAGASGLAIGLLLGVLFIAAGAGRIYLALRPGRSREKS